LSIKKVGNTYWLDIRIDGQRIRRSLKTDEYFEALDEAGRIKERLTSERKRGNITLDDFCKKYVDFAWLNKPRSAKRDEQRLAKLKQYFQKTHKITRLSEITPYHVEQLKAALASGKISEGKGKEKKLSKATINRYLQLIRRMFNVAITWDMYDKKNPIRGIRFYQEKSPRDSLSDDQVNKILESAKLMSRWPKSPAQKEFYDICMLAIHTGMRKSEILNLRWNDIKDEIILVEGKGERTREVPMNETVRRLLKDKPRRYSHVIDIPNRNSQDALRKSVDRIEREAGFPWSFHQFRHYFSTKLLEKGVDLVTISAILGHSQIKTSMIYTHAQRGNKINAVKLLD